MASQLNYFVVIVDATLSSSAEFLEHQSRPL
jgi:hypothetical protein